jgi:outer membrane protein OmpA-like peptidoglycan-associated protein
MIDYDVVEPESEGDDEQTASIYLSISDLMSSLFFLFLLLFVTSLIQLKESQEKLGKQKQSFINTLTKELQAADIKAEVNAANGDVTIKDGILFDKNSSILKPEGKTFLNKFIPKYSEIIFDSNNKEIAQQITRVVIEGHTSSEGDEDKNLELSLLRSLSVSKYILSKDIRFSTKRLLKTKILAAGRGAIEANSKIDEKDRKVMFRFQFKGEQLDLAINNGSNLKQ